VAKTTGRQDKDFLDQLFVSVSDSDVTRAIRDLFGDAAWVVD